jgi:DNA-binding NarL/FixJ family response regulator
MRVLLVGSPSDRARVRRELAAASIDVLAEFSTFRLARDSGVAADAIVVLPGRASHVDAAEDHVGVVDDDESFQEALTPREVQVVELLAEGLPNKAIAARLGISDQTVKFHVSSICGKLGAANRTDAVRRAVRRGLITF